LRDNANCRIAACFEDLMRTANRIKRWPVVTIMYFPTTDDTGHQWGAESRQFEKAMRNIDRLLGWILSAMEREGLDDSTYVVLVSDHGMAPCLPGRVLDLVPWLAEHRGMRVGRKFARPGGLIDMLAAYDALALTDGGRVASIHLRGPDGWQIRPMPAEVLEWLTLDPPIHELPAVAIAVIRDGTNRVRALTAGGSAVIERRLRDGIRTYRIQTNDADLSGLGAGNAGWHTSQEWLKLTAGTEFPDFVAQVVDLFDSPRTGDVVLFAAEGWSFERGLRGGHGSCLARDMHIPMYFAGPGLPAGNTISYARLVDLMPTILGLLGKADRLDGIGRIDGVNRAEQLRHRHADQRN
jgi:arylsulfatase A-like enzyme